MTADNRPEYLKRVNRVIDPLRDERDRLAGGGRRALARTAGADHRAALYRSWLPGSGYEPDDRPCFEIYRARVSVEGTPGAFRCELCMPVRPL